METATLKTMTAEACQRMRGRLWHNSLGFEIPGQWEISYNERIGRWYAGRNLKNGRRRYAYADTPEEALSKARTPGQYMEGS